MFVVAGESRTCQCQGQGWVSGDMRHVSSDQVNKLWQHNHIMSSHTILSAFYEPFKLSSSELQL